LVDFLHIICYYCTMKIKKNIYCIKLFINRTFLISAKNLILIDTGFPHQVKHVIRFIKSIGRKPEELSFIILTHHHIDHRGSARQLKKLTGCKIAAHKNDVPFIEGIKHSYREHKILWVKFLLFLTELIFGKVKVKVDKILEHGEKINGLSVYHTPGHTEGSISLFFKNEKILFCGDTVPWTLGKMKRPNPYTLDHKKEFTSIQTLSKLDFEILLPSDCKMVFNQAKKTLIDFCKQHKSQKH
jgi:hydroxyacylglutathione hydrolase